MPAKSQGSQCGNATQTFCMSALSSLHLSFLINTCVHSLSQSSSQAPLNEGTMMAFEPTLSSIAQLAESASANDISSAPYDSMTAAANKMKEQQRRYYICMLHEVVDEADVILFVLDARGWVPYPTGRGRGDTEVRSGGQSVSFLCSTKSVRKPHSFSSSSGGLLIFDRIIIT